MDLLNSSNLYGWLTAFIRRRARKKGNFEETKSLSGSALSLTASDVVKGNFQNDNLCTNRPQNNTNNKRIDWKETVREFFSTMDSEEDRNISSKSNENSIEEEIEELLTGGSSQENSGSGRLGSVGDLVTKRRGLFDVSASDQFNIDDDDLSGGGLAKHFQVPPTGNKGANVLKRQEDSHSQSHSLANASSINDISDVCEEAITSHRSVEQEIEERQSGEQRSGRSQKSEPQSMEERSGEVRCDDQHSGENFFTRSLEPPPQSVQVHRGHRSLDATLDFLQRVDDPIISSQEFSIERDRSIEEFDDENSSGDATLNASPSSSNSRDGEINHESYTVNDSNKASNGIHSDHDDTECTEDDIVALKKKILSINESGRSKDTNLVDISDQQHALGSTTQMERITNELNREVLEDITEEESEKVTQPGNDNTSNDFESIVSLNMIQMLENKVRDLQDVVASKDVCLASLNMQLDGSQKRDTFASVDNRDSLRELPPSGRDSSSLATNSTEYRTLQEEFGTKFFDFYNEISQRDVLIEKLTDSLQQSMQTREQLQKQSERLSAEIQQLRKQLNEALESVKKPFWPRDQESVGQRLSEISIDLVSESDDDLDRNFLTDNEDKISASIRNSKERQLSEEPVSTFDFFEPELLINKQIEQFQKCLTPEELRIFYMVHKKFDDFLSQELAKNRFKFEEEIKQLMDQLDAEKRTRDAEVNRLRALLMNVKDGSTELVQLRQELEGIHAREMEDLRTYFEKKCADLEKHYSEEVFSQKSQKNSADTNSDISEQDNLSEDVEADKILKEPSPRKRSRSELYTSPTHRQMTPTTLLQGSDDVLIGAGDFNRNETEPKISAAELKIFYQEKMHEIAKNHDEIIKKLNEKLKRFEAKYADDEFMTSNKTDNAKDIIAEDDVNIESIEIRKIAVEYERRLQEQVALAKADILNELERQIQTLLSETATDDNHWPPELILLREKFTAKSQLEIAQLQIKHEEEMARLKGDYEKQINRKLKRNSMFDSCRDLDQIVGEREHLRELSNTFRSLLCQLTKCVSMCEDDLNSTLLEEMQKYFLLNDTQLDQTQLAEGDGQSMDVDLNMSTHSNLQLKPDLDVTLSKKIRFIPDVSGLLSLIEDPSLIDFITKEASDLSSFNIRDCLEKLKAEADSLLQLSEKVHKDKRQCTEELHVVEKDRCEDENQLKKALKRSPKRLVRTASLNEASLRDDQLHLENIPLSLPPDINRLVTIYNESVYGDDCNSIPVSELNHQVNELKNQLVKSESDRQKLQEELGLTISKNKELGIELDALRVQLEQLDSQKESFSEGYGIDLKTPTKSQTIAPNASLSILQDKARNLLSTPTKKMGENTALLVQLIEDFCREGDKTVEESRKDKDDLQAQIDAADKQLKATRQFLEDQAAEREQERDDFLKEIEKLKATIKDKEKERSFFESASKELEQMDQQIKESSKHIEELEERKEKLETELKASIDKIFVLREIIAELEMQLETKSLNEHVLNEKVKELEIYIASQRQTIESLQNEIENLRSEVGLGYQEKIAILEEQLRNSRPTSEQASVIEQISEQMRHVEGILDQKIRTLESLHQAVNSTSCSTSPSEDVSVHTKAIAQITSPQGSPVHSTSKENYMQIDEVQKVFEKLAKHTRVEEAAIKKIRDLEMQIGSIRGGFGELQHERDLLQERMSEQLLRISSLQSKLDEQRHRAEEMQRQGTSELKIRIHDLQNEIMNLKEKLSARDKQLASLKNQLEQSKVIIDRQEAELSLGAQSDRSAIEKLTSELKSKTEENQKLKDRIKNEMINKLALPDLMETMLCDKNEEIDHLKKQLEIKEKELQDILNLNLHQGGDSSKGDNNASNGNVEAKTSGRTLSDIVSISEYDEPDVIRRAIPETDAALLALPPDQNYPEQMMISSKCPTAHANPKQKFSSAFFASGPPPMLNTLESSKFFQSDSKGEGHTTTPTFMPRKINFSDFADDSKMKKSTPLVQEISPKDEIIDLKTQLEASEGKVESLKMSLESIENEKNAVINRLSFDLAEQNKLNAELALDKQKLEQEVNDLHGHLEQFNKIEAELQEKCDQLTQFEIEFIQNKKEIALLQAELKDHLEEVNELRAKVDGLTAENSSLSKKVTDTTNDKYDSLTKQIEIFNKIIQEKDELLSKHEKNLLNYQQNEKLHLEKITQLHNEIEELQIKDNAVKLFSVRNELDMAKTELTQKAVLYEKCMLDLIGLEEEVKKLKDDFKSRECNQTDHPIPSTSYGAFTGESEHRQRRDEEIEGNLSPEQSNMDLLEEVERLGMALCDDSKPFSLEEMAEQLEKELNLSAQLDSSIRKAIESERANNIEFPLKLGSVRLIAGDSSRLSELTNQLEALKAELAAEKDKLAEVQSLLEKEKLQSIDIQQQDANIIEAMRCRLEAAVEKEEELHKVLDNERSKCEKLLAQLSILQRADSRKSSMMLRSPINSPRKSPRSSDDELDAIERFKSEIKLLTSQNDRERERIADLQQVLEREKKRFETELNERIDYSEKLKREMNKLLRDKETAEMEVEHLQERVHLSAREIESLEARIAALQDTETKRAQYRGRERQEKTNHVLEIEELKLNISCLEKERDHQNTIITTLRGDIERGAQRETKLAEALANSNGDTSLPEQFIQKLREMNTLLSENTKENRQMAETLQYLTEERKALQKKCDDLESRNQHNGPLLSEKLSEMEERALHLFGKYLKVESHRKALVHQKRYLLIVLQAYQESEAKALSLINANHPKKPERRSFKSVALVAVAIQRMKFIVKRWQTGKKLASKSIYNFTTAIPKRPTLIDSSVWRQQHPITDDDIVTTTTSTSPPCRDNAQSNNSNRLNNPLDSYRLIT